MKMLTILAFSYLLAEKISCSADLCMKKRFYNLRPDQTLSYPLLKFHSFRYGVCPDSPMRKLRLFRIFAVRIFHKGQFLSTRILDSIISLIVILCLVADAPMASVGLTGILKQQR